MKKLILILAIFIVSEISTAQAQSDSTKIKKVFELNQEQHKGFSKGKKDVFIDKDGDGICDQRVSGMGFKQSRLRHKYGKDGKQGGNK